jgi:8-oxo-dGTP pyrophosphatase MutT (NUDIX family)
LPARRRETKEETGTLLRVLTRATFEMMKEFENPGQKAGFLEPKETKNKRDVIDI